MSDKVYIFDEIVVPTSEGSALQATYMERYARSARARGMTLEGSWRSPPIALPDRTVTLHFLWSVADVGGWWAMRLGAARANPDLDVGIEGDDEKLRWWRFVDSIAVNRKRTFMVDFEEAASDV